MRAALLVPIVLLVETALGARLGLDLLARAGRLGVLALPLLLAELAWARLVRPRAPGAAARLERALRRLRRPGTALRLALLYAAATVACTFTVARAYDLAWRAGAVFALAALALGIAGELGWAAWRGGEARPAGVAGPLLWAALLAFLGAAVLPRIQGSGAGRFACLAAAALLVPLRLPGGRGRRALAGGLALLCLGGLAVDALRPAVRQLGGGASAPFSSVGLGALLTVTDLDRDGSSGLFGLDCDDLDAARSPLADDLPDDGVDQNCTGADASSARSGARHAPGGVRAPPPAAPAPSRRPDVVVVTVDALRADELTAERMPETFAWAEGCVRFRQARSSSNFTDFALFTLMSGLEPRHARQGYQMLIAPGDEARGRLSSPPLLGSALRAAGWSTAAVLPLFPARPFLFAGIDAARTLGRRREHPPAAEVLALGREALARLPAPRFLWLHLLDTHAPYLGGEAREDYHRAARALDGALGPFLREQSADAIVLVAADHGEAFGEHGAFTHQHTLYDEELRVPLVMCLPADLGAGGARTIDAPVGLVDVTPTLLELTGARAPYPRHGRSLLPALRGGAAPAGPGQPFETWLPRHHLQGLLEGCLKWMRDLDREWEALYDVCADPGETQDLGRARPDEAARLRGRFFEILDDDLDAYRSWR